MYDYLIVGSGIFGSVFAYEANKLKKKCLVIEKKDYIGGNCASARQENINYSLNGPHILNSNNDKIWNYINNLCEIEQYRHTVKVNYKNNLFSFPVNMNTFNELWGINNPIEVEKYLELNKKDIKKINNFKEWVISQLGEEIYNIFYKGYSEKQWGVPCEEIPVNIAKRIPIKYYFDNSYHNTKYSGIPKSNDYNQIFYKLLDKIEIELGCDFNIIKNKWKYIAKKLVLSSPLDEFFDYKYGYLDYRSLKFENEVKDVNNFQGISQMNFTEKEIPYTRIIEHQWFSPNNRAKNKTIITKEYSEKWELGKNRYYPVNDIDNNKIYERYKKEILKDENIIFGGRLARFQYLNMDQVFANALKEVEKEFKTL